MTRRHRYSLLIVRGDGSRVFRLNLPRRAAGLSVVFLVVLASALGGLVGDWAKLRQLTREARADRELLAEQRRLIDGVSQRISALSRETDAWRDLHGRIWEALGPERAPGASPAGIGGSARPLPPRSVRPDLDRLAESIVEEGEKLRALERVMARAGKVIASLPSSWPLRGPVNSEFGRRVSPWSTGTEFHAGIDIGARMGTPVHAPASGTIVTAGSLGDRGLAVVIDHGQEIRSHYAHLSRVSVHQGQNVTRGALIGYSGNTGRSTGPHLHYEILVKGRPVNPRGFLWD